jgi:peroxiredoxin Q/BCP
MAEGRMCVGEPAPPFSLPDQSGKRVALTDLAGRWAVLYFYPKDDTPGCTVEACEFTDSLHAFQGLDAIVLGCSADSPESHRKFIAKHRLGITLLSDADHAVMKSYGAWGEKTMYGRTGIGVLRSTVLIDPAGKVAHHWPNVKAAGHAEKVRDKLAELRQGLSPETPVGFCC